MTEDDRPSFLLPVAEFADREVVDKDARDRFVALDSNLREVSQTMFGRYVVEIIALDVIFPPDYAILHHRWLIDVGLAPSDAFDIRERFDTEWVTSYVVCTPAEARKFITTLHEAADYAV